MATRIPRQSTTQDTQRFVDYPYQSNNQNFVYFDEPQVIVQQTRNAHHGAFSDFGNPTTATVDPYVEFRNSRSGRVGYENVGINNQQYSNPQYIPPQNVQYSNASYSEPLNINAPVYSGRIPASVPDSIGDVVGDEVKEYNKEKRNKKRTQEQIMPSIARHRQATIAVEEPVAIVASRPTTARSARVEREVAPTVAKQTETRVVASPKPALKPQDKKMLAVYIAIVLAVAIAIIATGVAIGASNVRASALENQLIETRQELALQEAELSRLSDEAYLALRAGGQGLVPNTNGYSEVPLIELQGPQSIDAPTNWFDRFSRFISNMFR